MYIWILPGEIIADVQRYVKSLMRVNNVLIFVANVYVWITVGVWSKWNLTYTQLINDKAGMRAHSWFDLKVCCCANLHSMAHYHHQRHFVRDTKSSIAKYNAESDIAQALITVNSLFYVKIRDVERRIRVNIYKIM